VVRQAGIGKGWFGSDQIGTHLANVITGFRRGAIVGMDQCATATAELGKDGAQPHAHIDWREQRVGEGLDFE